MGGPNDGLSKEDLAAINAGAAPYANRFIVTGNGVGVRITFLEQIDVEQPSAFRAAVVLSQGDASALQALLGRVLSPPASTED